jgi:tetratricopeptide (TPR) repeat protein
MRPYRAAALAVIAGFLVPSVAFACLWDYDTIKTERTRFPGTLELITGKFLRHSPEFYQWRIANRLKRLKTDPTSAALLDDLAAAYDKTGQHDKAIETAIKTENLHPGRYETAANLATFYFHAGKLEEGLPHIDRALKINPDAHFGREKYQKLLVEYTIKQRRGGPLKLPLSEVIVNRPTAPEKQAPSDTITMYSFDDYLRSPSGKFLTQDEKAAAVKGILGMMKFGKHDSPVLLEALGSLLTNDYADPAADAKLLAARAYLKASYELPEGPARAAYRKMAAQAIQMQMRRDQPGQMTLEQLEADFQKELEEARAWYADLRERELSWIRGGKDPEAEFDKLYETEPEVSGMDVKDPMSPNERLNIFLIVCGVVLGLIALAVVLGAVACVVILARIKWRDRKTRTEPGRTDAAR